LDKREEFTLDRPRRDDVLDVRDELTFERPRRDDVLDARDELTFDRTRRDDVLLVIDVLEVLTSFFLRPDPVFFFPLVTAGDLDLDPIEERLRMLDELVRTDAVDRFVEAVDNREERDKERPAGEADAARRAAIFASRTLSRSFWIWPFRLATSFFAFAA
jgi:hypothetical protein